MQCTKHGAKEKWRKTRTLRTSHTLYANTTKIAVHNQAGIRLFFDLDFCCGARERIYSILKTAFGASVCASELCAMCDWVCVQCIHLPRFFCVLIFLSDIIYFCMHWMHILRTVASSTIKARHDNNHGQQEEPTKARKKPVHRAQRECASRKVPDNSLAW